jgi:hypothetical protein
MVSTAALAQQSKGWYVGSGTIEANTRVPRSTIWDSLNHVRALTDTDLRVFHRKKAMSRRGRAETTLVTLNWSLRL